MHVGIIIEKEFAMKSVSVSEKMDVSQPLQCFDRLSKYQTGRKYVLNLWS
jgi:hypothetical protein